ncbi:MAG: NAD(P)H-dependent oxidoreductase subunit E [Phycisphaerales bacterium]|nr:NAD(P)H-dependent oxidoreductase subunit E [Phycisphaerales bacterium]
MTSRLDDLIVRECRAHSDDRHRLLDILHDVARREGQVSAPHAAGIADRLGLSTADVIEAVHFFDRFHDHPRGCTLVQVSDDAVSRLRGSRAVITILREHLESAPGSDDDAHFRVQPSGDMGLADQGPVVLVDDVVIPEVGEREAHVIGTHLREGRPASGLITSLGDGNNAHPLVHSAVHNHVRQVGPVIFRPMARGEALRKAVRMTPAEVMRAVKTARLRGRGIDSLPTGVKWGFVRAACAERVESLWGQEAAIGRDYSREFDRIMEVDERYVVCIACDPEPGSFRDRVMLTECAERVFAGMTIAGYAVGARLGLLYIREEYAYLVTFLEALLAKRAEDGLLGQDICGKRGFDFEIQVRLGAHPHVLGEETSIIAACEGRAGAVHPRPPYPTSCGYLGHPTATNCAETLCCVSKILDEGSGSFCECGTSQSAGTKLLCVSGDCRRPGVYEVPFGISIRSVLELAGAENTGFVLLSGQSPRLTTEAEFAHRIGYEHVATTGSIQCFARARDPLAIIASYAQALHAEQCGACVPCRGGLPLVREMLDRFAEGTACRAELDQLHRLAEALRTGSLCVLGKAAGKFLSQALEDHRSLFESRARGQRAVARSHIEAKPRGADKPAHAAGD